MAAHRLEPGDFALLNQEQSPAGMTHRPASRRLPARRVPSWAGLGVADAEDDA